VSGEKSKKPPYLVIYRQRGSEYTLNAFVDWREDVSFVSQAKLEINETQAGLFDPVPLVPRDLSRIKLRQQIEFFTERRNTSGVVDPQAAHALRVVALGNVSASTEAELCRQLAPTATHRSATSARV